MRADRIIRTNHFIARTTDNIIVIGRRGRGRWLFLGLTGDSSFDRRYAMLGFSASATVDAVFSSPLSGTFAQHASFLGGSLFRGLNGSGSGLGCLSGRRLTTDSRCGSPGSRLFGLLGFID